MARLNSVQLEEIVPGVDTQVWLGPLNDAFSEWQINSPQRIAAFLAQVAHESRNLQSLEENLRYSAKRLREVWPKRFPDAATAEAYAGDPEKLANRVYAGRLGNGDEASGDGWRYRGRGLIQLTGRSNYAACKAALGEDVVRYPERVRDPATAARSAAWFWSSRGLNQLADHEPGDDDEQDFTRITTIINGGKVGLSARFFTNSGSRCDISAIVRRHTGAGERENGQIVRCRAARGEKIFLSVRQRIGQMVDVMISRALYPESIAAIRAGLFPPH